VVQGAEALAIDTASPEGAVALALARDGRIFEERLPQERRASEELLNAVARCLERAGMPLARVARIAVCAGPGSFTGIRVGLAAAWGLARASGISVETVSTLEAMAEASRDLAAAATGMVWTALDAGRGELVAQAFGLEGARASARGEAVRIPNERLGVTARGALVVTLPRALADPPAPSLSRTPAHALALAVARAPRAETAADFTPIYARPSAAEELRGPA
jgi:tRNA threonylcarbamoyladenosine biosynthesis protein TsaB